MRSFKLSPAPSKILCALLAIALPAIHASAESLQLGSTTLQIRQNGQIASFKSDAETLIRSGELVAQPLEGKSAAIQWNTKAQISASAAKIDASGTLQGQSADESIRFNLAYDKAAENSFTVSASATYLGSIQWRRPAYYFLTFPASDYMGASVVIEDASGKEITYTVGDNALNIKGNQASRITFIKGGNLVSIEAGEKTRLLLLDSRGWGGDFLRVDVTMSRPWKAVQDIAAGTEDTFKATISLRQEN